MLFFSLQHKATSYPGCGSGRWSVLKERKKISRMARAVLFLEEWSNCFVCQISRESLTDSDMWHVMTKGDMTRRDASQTSAHTAIFISRACARKKKHCDINMLSSFALKQKCCCTVPLTCIRFLSLQPVPERVKAGSPVIKWDHVKVRLRLKRFGEIWGCVNHMDAVWPAKHF